MTGASNQIWDRLTNSQESLQDEASKLPMNANQMDAQYGEGFSGLEPKFRMAFKKN